jgi:hypothetical protein
MKSTDQRRVLESEFNALLLKYLSSILDLKSARLIDLLKILVPEDLPIYNTKGILVKTI